MSDLSAATKREHKSLVHGKLVDEDSAPIISSHIEFFAKGIRSETELGEATTGEQGQYAITYFRPSAFNLMARACDTSLKPQAVIAQSATTFNVSSKIKIDFTSAASALIRKPSTFASISKPVTAHLQEARLTDLRENKDTHEPQFLASEQAFPSITSPARLSLPPAAF